MMLEKQIIINTNPSETRLALLEKEQVTKLYIERRREKSLIGNIYKAEVLRVLPGMQSAFINIGTHRSAFLYGGDVFNEEILVSQGLAGDNPDDDVDKEEVEKRVSSARVPIEKVLREGQKIMVQVSKDPIGTKGARVTMYLSIPGRYVVLMPFFSHIGVSRRIDDDRERGRLKDLIRKSKPKDVGVIVRTAAKGVESALIANDLDYLLTQWAEIRQLMTSQKAPSLVYEEINLVHRVVRDVYSEDISRMVVDDEKVYARLKQFLVATIPGGVPKLKLYDGEAPIFDVYGIEMDINRALSRRIDLPSGGYIVIDQTEALTSFDVNTGRFVGKANANDTIFRTNLEAVKKIVAQLRLRNIGGIIVLDLIDMENGADREKIYQVLQEELKADNARTNVLRISELGLIQMTRKRSSDSLERQLLEPCPLCDGRGRVKSIPTEAHDLMRELVRRAVQTGQKKLRVLAREDLRDWIMEEEFDIFQAVTEKYQLEVDFIPNHLTLQALHEPSFEVLAGHGVSKKP